MSSSLNVHQWDVECDWRNAQRATRDLIGEPAHLIAAIFALVMEPISTATSSIGFTTLVVVGVLRSPVLLPIWGRMLTFAWVKLLLIWLGWTALSIAWSPDPSTGVDRLWNLKFLAWIPLLWPLHRQWKWLLGGFLFATLVLQGIQISGEFFGRTYKGHSLRGGSRHPTMAGLWNATALSCWLFLAVASGWRTMVIALPMTVLCALGFFWAGQRAALVGILCELLIANAVFAWVAKGFVRRAMMRALVGAVVVGTVYLFAGEALTAKVVQVSKEATQSLQGDAPEIAEARLAMWKLSLEAWKSRPIMGVGLGGYQHATATIDVKYTRDSLHVYKTPHSTYITILTESGLIGLALFLAWSAAFFARSIACLRLEPIRIGVFGGAIIWFTAAAFDTFTARGVFLSIGTIMITLTVMPPSRPSRA